MANYGIRRGLTALVAAAALQVGAAMAAAPLSLPVEGTWLTDSLTEMTIAACPQGYCGFISKIVVPEKYRQQYGAQLDKVDPSTYQDVNNKDPKLRSRPIQGLQILTLHATSNPSYFEGEIYNPEDGNIYSGSVEVTSLQSIKLKGCVLYVLCQEQLWQRVPDPVQ